MNVFSSFFVDPSICVPISYSDEAALILIRHGESLWNEKNLFTGCVDVPLTRKGVEEAIEAGKRISNIPVDVIYTSALIRAQMTAMLAMAQHRRKKVIRGKILLNVDMEVSFLFLHYWGFSDLGKLIICLSEHTR